MSQPAPGTLSPLDGSPLEPISATPVEDIAGLVAKAREAQASWAARSLDDRIAAVMAFAADALDRHEEIVSILMAETGRSRLECELNEGYGILEYAKGARKVATKALKLCQQASQYVRLFENDAIEEQRNPALDQRCDRSVVACVTPGRERHDHAIHSLGEFLQGCRDRHVERRAKCLGRGTVVVVHADQSSTRQRYAPP